MSEHSDQYLQQVIQKDSSIKRMDSQPDETLLSGEPQIDSNERKRSVMVVNKKKSNWDASDGDQQSQDDDSMGSERFYDPPTRLRANTIAHHQRPQIQQPHSALDISKFNSLQRVKEGNHHLSPDPANHLNKLDPKQLLAQSLQLKYSEYSLKSSRFNQKKKRKFKSKNKNKKNMDVISNILDLQESDLSHFEFQALQNSIAKETLNNSPQMIKETAEEIRGIKECRGYVEIPKVFVEQTRAHRENQKILYRMIQDNEKKQRQKQITLKSRRSSIESRNMNNSSFNMSYKEESPSRVTQLMRLISVVSRKSDDGLSQQQDIKMIKQLSLHKQNSNNISMAGQHSTNLANNQDDIFVDSEDDSESDQCEQEMDQNEQNRIEVENSFMVFKPDSIIRATWDISLFLIIVYQAIVLPMRISFEMQYNEFIFYLEIVIDCMFMIDIIFNFNTGFYLGPKLYMSRKQIAREYLCPWLFIDVISSVPYTWILAAVEGLSIKEIEQDDTGAISFDKNGKAIAGQIGADGSGGAGAMASAPQLLRLLKIAKMLKMLKLLRVMKIKKLLAKFDEWIVTDSMNLMMTFFQLTVTILVICHYIGCTFYYFGLDEFRSDPNYDGWLIANDMLTKNFISKYIVSTYWAFTTMAAVGYGDIHPITEAERTLGMIVIIFSSGIFAYVINRISSTVQSYNTAVTQFREKMMYVNLFMKEKKMGKALQLKVRRFLDYEFEKLKENKLDDQGVFRYLNDELCNQITITLRGRTISSIIFLKVFGVEFIAHLSQSFKDVTFAHDEFIFHERDKSQMIYYIHRGKVAMIEKHSHTFIKDIGTDCYFGELGVLTGNERTLSAKCRDFTEALTIKEEDFYRTCENYREALSAVERIKKELMKDNFKSLMIYCYICGQCDHISTKCPMYEFKKGNLIKLYMEQSEKSKFQGIRSFFKSSSVANENFENMTQHQQEIICEERNQSEKKQKRGYYPSAEDSDEVELKQKYIGIYVQENKEKDFDGRLIAQIFYNPKKYHKNYMKEKKIRLSNCKTANSHSPSIKRSITDQIEQQASQKSRLEKFKPKKDKADRLINKMAFDLNLTRVNQNHSKTLPRYIDNTTSITGIMTTDQPDNTKMSLNNQMYDSVQPDQSSLGQNKNSDPWNTSGIQVSDQKNTLSHGDKTFEVGEYDIQNPYLPPSNLKLQPQIQSGEQFRTIANTSGQSQFLEIVNEDEREHLKMDGTTSYDNTPNKKHETPRLSLKKPKNKNLFNIEKDDDSQQRNGNEIKYTPKLGLQAIAMDEQMKFIENGGDSPQIQDEERNNTSSQPPFQSPIIRKSGNPIDFQDSVREIQIKQNYGMIKQEKIHFELNQKLVRQNLNHNPRASSETGVPVAQSQSITFENRHTFGNYLDDELLGNQSKNNINSTQSQMIPQLTPKSNQIIIPSHPLKIISDSRNQVRSGEFLTLNTDDKEREQQIENCKDGDKFVMSPRLSGRRQLESKQNSDYNERSHQDNHSSHSTYKGIQSNDQHIDLAGALDEHLNSQQKLKEEKDYYKDDILIDEKDGIDQYNQQLKTSLQLPQTQKISPKSPYALTPNRQDDSLSNKLSSQDQILQRFIT